MSSVPRTRYREGFTTSEQFIEELRLLRYTEAEISVYLAAGDLEYATDYTRDLIGAYRDAVRKGHITMDQYRILLVKLGLVPERAEGYVMRERARLKPEEPLTAITPPKPYYETDAGRIQVDTIRRLRRKLLITRDQEKAGLLELGIPVNEAEAAVANDDVRLAEKAAEE
ncbi:hypothetical protein ES703_95065 [subsurface metagenome]